MHFEHQLFRMVQGRPRPEDVAEVVLRAMGDRLGERAHREVSRAAQGSLARAAGSFSSMATEFFRARVQTEPQLRLAGQLFAAPPLEWKAPVLEAADYHDAEKVAAFVREVAPLIHKTIGEHRKLDKAARRALGLFKGHRWYGKRFRLLVHLEDKIERMLRSARRFDLVRISKSSLATRIPYQLFAQDLGTACLVAYLAARMSVRSDFTCGPQQRAFDQVAEALLEHCERSGTTSWLCIAHVLQDRRVVRRLTEEERGILLGASFDVLGDAAELLRETWAKSRFDRSTMIVRKGCDSSTWNEVAGAWNRAREAWISLLHALGLGGLLDRMLPGKVMRLMAADVAAWHRLGGGSTHPDTAVWAELPPPWEVLAGTQVCPRALVEETCTRHGVSIEGWAGPKPDRQAVAFRPTPELVHGVTVSSPKLALVLRRLGVFSGKALRGRPETVPVHVVRDALGFAVAVVPVSGTEGSSDS